MKQEFFRTENRAILTMDNVSMSFSPLAKGEEENTVIQGMNLKVHEGELLVLVGPSGCGKTTLLSLMAGITKPSDGHIYMGEQEITGPDWRREIVFQSPTLYPWYDVYDNVAYGLKARHVDKEIIDQKVKEFLELVNLSNYIHAKTYELSGGMKQRVALARVLINEPEVILMDEPFSALDAFTRRNMQVSLREIWRKKSPTIVLITHDVDEALELASRIVVLSKNPCEIKGQFNAMFSTPLHGDISDDSVMKSGEYVELRRHILDLLKDEI